MKRVNFAHITIEHLKLIHTIEDSFRLLKQMENYQEFIDVLKLKGKEELETPEGLLYFQYDSQNDSLRIFRNDGLSLLISGMSL